MGAAQRQHRQARSRVRACSRVHVAHRSRLLTWCGLFMFKHSPPRRACVQRRGCRCYCSSNRGEDDSFIGSLSIHATALAKRHACAGARAGGLAVSRGEGAHTGRGRTEAFVARDQSPVLLITVLFESPRSLDFGSRLGGGTLTLSACPIMILRPAIDCN